MFTPSHYNVISYTFHIPEWGKIHNLQSLSITYIYLLTNNFILSSPHHTITKSITFPIFVTRVSNMLFVNIVKPSRKRYLTNPKMASLKWGYFIYSCKNVYIYILKSIYKGEGRTYHSPHRKEVSNNPKRHELFSLFFLVIIFIISYHSILPFILNSCINAFILFSFKTLQL